jgi:general secretion pathway protein D
MKGKSAIALLSLVLCLVVGKVAAQPLKSIEFKNQEVRDILFALAGLSGASIVPDDTVTGKTSFFFSNMEYDAAIRLFIESNNLFSWKREGILYVSKIRVEQDPATKLLSVTCREVPMRSLVQVISNIVGKTILFDQLPQEPVTFHIEALGLKEALGVVVAKYPELWVDSTDSYFYLRRRDPGGQGIAKPGNGYFTKEKELYSIEIERARFRDLVLDLFAKSGKEVVFLMDQDTVMEDLRFRDKSFEDMLRLLLLKCGGDFSISGGVYYIIEAQKKDLQSKFLTTLIVPLQWISVQDLQRLMPPALSASSKMKLDDKDSRVILNGAAEELRSVVDFIALIDTPATNDKTVRVDLSFLKSDEAIPLLPYEYSVFGPVPLPSKTGFVIGMPEKKLEGLREFIALVDRQEQSVPVTLNYIKADDLLAALPPSAAEKSVKKTPDPRLVFYTGPEAARKAFLRDLAAIDRPKPQVKYQLLVLSLSETKDDSWEPGLTLTDSDESPGATLKTGTFQSLMNVGFDVIASFGIDFALSLQWKIQNNKASVVADTVLAALSGEKITFKNTTTIRVKDTEVVSSTTTTTTQIIREISSGLILTLEGWVSGNRMITMKIDSTLSDSVESDSDTDLPKTTEKVFATTVRSLVGKPIAVTGLNQKQIVENVSKVPILGDIPLLGWAFRTKTKSLTDTQYQIYIIPRLEMPEVNREALERNLVEDYYRYLFAQDSVGSK